MRSPKLATPRQIDASMPAEVDRIVLRALDANREARYQTAAELGSDLDAVLRTIRPTPTSAELGAYLAHLLGRDRTGPLPAVEEAAPAAKLVKARPEPAAQAPSRKRGQAPPPSAAEPAAPVPLPEVSQPVRAKKPLPMGAIGAAAAVVLAAVVGVVVMTRERPSAPAAGEVTATPAPETVEMARQIAQQEVDRREGEMRERLTREILVPTPVPNRAAATAAVAAPLPTAVAAAPTPVPAVTVPTEVPEPPSAAPQAAAPAAAQVEPTALPTAPPATRAPAPAPAPPSAVRRGDLVDVADTDVEAILTPKAAYPPLARRQRIGGVVILRALIDENGTVQEVQVLRGVKPDLGLDAAATSAVRAWRFRPATKDGVPVKLWKTITIPFQP